MPPSCHSAATNRDDDQTAFIDRVIGGDTSGIDEAIAEFERGADSGHTDPDGGSGSVDS